MRYLGIDYGDKRIGVALSDAEGTIAFPRETIENRGDSAVLSFLKDIIKKEGVDALIVGLPLGQDRKETEQTKKVQAFIGLLHREIMLPVDSEDELLTTSIARGEGIEKEHVDASAAALILQTYLDKQKK